MATFAETVAKLRELFGIESSLSLPGAIARLNQQMGLPPTGTLPFIGRNGSGRIS